VLHALQGAGVVFQTLNSLKLSGWSIEGVYRCQRQQ
jgi:2-oxoglutarate dehydrogenase complex dehydrogenase (E1) component-like enzyme